MSKNWYFVINPVSGNGKGIETWEVIHRLLQKSEIGFEFDISEFHQHTIQLIAKKHASGYRKFIGIGGDGTINEIINGIFISNNASSEPSVVSLISVGTGNDWVRNHTEPLTATNIVSKITSNQTYLHDVGVVKILDNNQQSFFINVAGAGIDGSVVQELEKANSSGNKGKLAYIKSLITALLNYQSPHTKIAVDANEFYAGETLLIAAAKGQFFGSGMHISPQALPGNGNLDITLVKNDSKWIIFPQLYKLFTSQIASVTFVQKSIGKQIEIHFQQPIPIQTDGELVGSFKNIQFSLIKQGVMVLR